MVLDKEGALGVGMRRIFGTHDEPTIRVVIAMVHICTLLAQTWFSASANIFTPVHKLFYLIFQVQGTVKAEQTRAKTVGWSYATRIVLERWIEVSRLLLVLLAVLAHVLCSTKPTSLAPNQPLVVGDWIATCAYFPSLQQCSPHYLSLAKVDNNSYRLGVYKSPTSYRFFPFSSSSSSSFSSSSSTSGNDATSLSSPIWSVDIVDSKASATSVVEARLGEDGGVRVVSSSSSLSTKIESDDSVVVGKPQQPAEGQERLLWSSSSVCPRGGPSDMYLSLEAKSGMPFVQCGDGSTIRVDSE